VRECREKQKARTHEQQHCTQPWESYGAYRPTVGCPAESLEATITKIQALSGEDRLSPSLSHEKQLPPLY